MLVQWINVFLLSGIVFLAFPLFSMKPKLPKVDYTSKSRDFNLWKWADEISLITLLILLVSYEF